MCDCLKQIIAVVNIALPIALWAAFWLLAVNWQKLWPLLRVGGWTPAVVLILISACVWSRLAPASCHCLKVITIPDFWWQLGAVSSLAGTALFCGWLQGYMGWTPPIHPVEPPAGDHHDHGAAHAHH